MVRGAANLPITLLESLVAGTPSVAFGIGGVPDIVRHMETGYLCRYKDSEDLARGIQTLLMNVSMISSMRLRCRDVATREYAREVQAWRYVEVYEDALNLRRKTSGADVAKSS